MFKDFLGNLEISTSKLPSVARRVGGYARVTATNLFLILNQMSSNTMSFTEPVPLGTWQSSVLISVKLLMFQGDVLFFWQGSVLINVTSILHVGILVSSGTPHEILFTHPKLWSFPRFFSQPGGRGDA